MANSHGLGVLQRIAAGPLWVRLVLLTVLVGVSALLSKWLILLLLISLGLWPLTLLLGLAILALLSTKRGGWPWMRAWLATRLNQLLIPILSVLSALIIGGLVIMLTDQAVHHAIGAGQVGRAAGLAFGNVARAYAALYQGALGDPFNIISAIFRAIGGEGLRPITVAVRGPSDSLVQSVPYIFAGLAVALGFRSGLFNIGAEGQIAWAGWRPSWSASHSPACPL